MNKHYLTEEKCLKIKKACLFLFVLFLILNMQSYILHATDFYVKPNGNDSASGLDWNNAWRTIQCAATNMTNGDTTYISNGTYHEQIDVEYRTNIQFIGYGDTVKIEGDQYTNYGFCIKDSQSVKVAHLLLYYNKTAMIFLSNSHQCIISNNLTTENNLNYEYGCGIKLISCNSNLIISNTVSLIEAPPLSQTSHCYGISLYLSHNNSIIGNEVKESGSGAEFGGVNIWCHGIYLKNSDNNMIRYNYLHDMDHYGIHIVATSTEPSPYVNLNNKILDNRINGMDYGILTENWPGTPVTDSLRGQVIGRNKIWNVARPIKWYSSASGDAGKGGYIYKNSITIVSSNNPYPEAVYLSCNPSYQSSKVNFQYNSIQGFYYGLRFDNNGYCISNSAINGAYSYNISRNLGSGAQSIHYCSTQTSKIRDITGGDNNIDGDPDFTGIYNTQLEHNSPCIQTGSPGSDGVRGSIGRHTTWFHARDESANNTTIYTMVFVTSPYDGAIPGDGKIIIKFPSDFSFSTPSVVSKNFDGSLFTSTAGTTITFTRSGGTTIPPGKPIRIIFNNINNPNYNYNGHYCTITIMSNNGVLIEQEDSNHFRTTNATHILTVTTNMTIKETNIGALNMRIMSITVQDTHLHYLESIKIGNAGTMVQSTDISNIKIYLDRDGNNYYTPPDPNTPGTGDVYITNLIWNGTYWSNGNLSSKSHLLSYPGANLLITVDYAPGVSETRYIKPYIPKDGIKCSEGLTTPITPLTNQGEIWHFAIFILNYQIQQHNAAYSAIGDINNDAWLDYVISGCIAGGSPATKRIHRFLNDGTGTLGSALNCLSVDRAPIVLGDLDNDGDLDLIATGQQQGVGFPTPLTRFLNDGTGVFGSSLTIGPVLSDGYLVLGDIDKDGDLDLIAAGTSHLEIYHNNGDATFSAPKSFGTPLSGNCAIALADFNNDTYPDLITCGNNYMQLYLNKADNTGEFGTMLPFTIGYDMSSISTGDLNNDGWQDFIVTGDKNLSVYLNNKDNTFTRKTYKEAYPMGNISLGDIDNDGDLDVCVMCTSWPAIQPNAKIDIYFNDGNGNLSGPYTLSTIGNNSYRKTCVLGDIDNDGDLDLITNNDFNLVNIWENISSINNQAPYNPVSLIQDVVDYKWRFRWQANPQSDDHTSDTMLRYKISIGTNQSGTYDYISDILDYPRGQADIGNIYNPNTRTYQSRIPSNKTVYWKVNAIDTSFKISTNSLEISITPTGMGPYYVATNGDDSNAGTNGAPFRTIQRAVNVMSAGPTNVGFPWCYVGPGIYNETVNIASNLNPDFILITALSNNNPPVLDGNSSSNIAFYITNVNHIRIANMVIKNYTDSGIRISGQNTNVRIYRNLIYNNPVNISINGSATNCELINNTIFKSISGDGVQWNDTSGGVMHNNIILSNNQYGVNRNSTSQIFLSYNNIYGNTSGATNGNLKWGGKNYFGDPIIETITSFTIQSRYSYALDTATNIIGVSDVYNGNGPDMGWRESSVSNIHHGPFYVDVTNGLDQNPGTLDRPFRTIQCAVDRMQYGIEITSATCFIMSGEYFEYINIIANSNPGYMVFTAYNTNNHPILDGQNHYSYGIRIAGADKVIIDHFDIKSYQDRGIYIHYLSGDHANSNYIVNCQIYSNDYGIYQLGRNNWPSPSYYVQATHIINNSIYNNNYDGIYGYFSPGTRIFRNCIYNNNNGIYLTWQIGSESNFIFNNTFHNNTASGITISSYTTAYIYNNILLSNGSYGINQANNGWSRVGYNVITGHSIAPVNGTTITMEKMNFIDVDPLIDTSFPFEIISGLSPAVDNASNIAGVSDTWNGKGPDMGWKESNFSATYYVHILTPIDTWTNSINNALGIAKNDISIECSIPPWKYNEYIHLEDRTNIIIRARDWIDNQNKTSTVLNGLNYNDVLKITNCKNITVEGFKITNASYRGINMSKSLSNNILYNDIVNHGYCGIWIHSADTEYNLIYGNDIYDSGPNIQDYGIYISEGSYTIIKSNNINNHYDEDGIYIEGIGKNNIISKNIIKSNYRRGIYINSSTISNCSISTNKIYDNNLTGLYIIGSSFNNINANTFYDHLGGYQQDHAVYITDGDKNTIRENVICNQDYSGITLNGNAQSNKIIKNEIYSNRRISSSYASVLINNDTADFTTIASNKFYENYRGITIVGAEKNKIIRNLFYNHYLNTDSIAVYLYSSSLTNEIYHNTFYNNNCGLYLGNPASTAKVTNNIFLSHRQTSGGYSGYALFSAVSTPGLCSYDYNIFWDNSYITNNVSAFVKGVNNIYEPPQIDTSGTFEIIFPNSPAIDNAKVIPWLNIPSQGSGPDIGWKESVYDSVNKTNLVHVLPSDVWTNSITNALKIADNNYIIECHIYSNFTYYPESVKINGFTNLIIRSYNWTNSRDNTNTIIDAFNKSYAVKITNSKNITIQGFLIRNGIDGIIITDSVSNHILNNHIINNFNTGIIIDSTNSIQNRVASNYIYNEFSVEQDYGIIITNAHKNIVFNNQIYDNNEYGIHLKGISRSNIINQNQIFNYNGLNQDQGIHINNSDYNRINNNQIYKHTSSYGITLDNSARSNDIINNHIYSNYFGVVIYNNSGSHNNTISSNKLHHHDIFAIYIGVSINYTKIYRNCIYENGNNSTEGGIHILNGSVANIINNTIVNNYYGIRGYVSSPLVSFFNNIIMSNTAYGIDIISSTAKAGYNMFLGNGTDYRNLTLYAGNIFGIDPLIETTTSFTIQSPFSMAIDSATNYYNEAFNEYGPDRGWKEADFPTPVYVHILPHDEWTDSISHALERVTNNCTLVCYPKTNNYFESIYILNRTNITILADAWTNKKDNTNTIIDGDTWSRAVRIENSKNITINGFTIQDATYYGIDINNSESNTIINNKIINNGSSGIYIRNDLSDNNMIASNTIRNINGSVQDYGVYLSNGDHNILYFNQIKYNTLNGIYLTDTAQSNNIIKNIIYSNTIYGIEFNGSSVMYNNVNTNQIYKNQASGIYINTSGNNRLLRNRIYYNNGYGLCGTGSATFYIYTYNNVFFKNTSGGIFANNGQPRCTYIYCYNNIFLSNNNYGVRGNNTGAPVGRVYLYYNTFYNNTLAPWYDQGGTIILGSGNITNQDPLINTVSSFTIISPSSTCIDTGTNVFSEPINGYEIDRGWKESDFTASNYVHILPHDEWTDTIMHALEKVTNNAMLICYPKPINYQESIVLSDRTNITILANAWTNTGDNTNTIMDSTGFSRAITIENSKKITINGFTIQNASSYGIDINSSCSNTIINNRIINHGTRGINIQDNLSDNNLISSNVIKNTSGSAQNYGLYLSEADNNKIYNNIICKNDNQGIYIEGTAMSNNIINNNIYSNSSHGIYFYGGSVDLNFIMSNIIFQNNGCGIYFYYSDYNKIYRNLIYKNTSVGVYTRSSADYSKIYNNTIYSNDHSGVYGDSIAYIYNNVLLSNYRYGVEGTDTRFNVGYNSIFGNRLGHYNQNINIRPGNLTNQDPMIDTTSNFTIISSNSPVIDMALIISNVSDSFQGNGPDMGWKESDYTNTIPYAVWILPPNNIWTRTIEEALNQATNNCIIQCYSTYGPFYESVYIHGFTNLIIRSHDWTNSNDNTNTFIIAQGANHAVTITNSCNITIQGFSIKEANDDGIYITGSKNNKILNNRIFSNSQNDATIEQGINIYNSISNQIISNDIFDHGDYGVYIQTEGSDNNYIAFNKIHNHSSAKWQNYGIYIYLGDLNTIYFNTIYNHNNLNDFGIYIDTSMSNNLLKNQVYSNYDGIYFNNNLARYNNVLTNQIFQNNRSGIFIWYSDNNYFKRNKIYKNSSYGYYSRYSSANEIVNNVFFDNNDGVYSHQSSTYVFNNIFMSNQNYGIYNNASTVYVGYNIFYYNVLSPYNSVTLRQGNITGIDPMINTTTSFTIQSPLSIAVDNATNYYLELFQGNGLDIGWKESSFTQTQLTNYVHILPADKWTNSITNAVAFATNNSIIECLEKPGGFYESVYITEKTNIILRSKAWTNRQDNTTTVIYALGFNNGIIITNSKHITVEGFTIKLASRSGIYINNAVSNNILNNKIVDNASSGNYSGIEIVSDMDSYNIIASNEIYDNGTTYQNYGIYINDNDHNTIFSNKIHNNTTRGIYFTGNPQSNTIINNSIYNELYGIVFTGGADNNKIIANNIYNNSAYGIWFYATGPIKNNLIRSNKIHNNILHGLYLEAAAQSNNIIKNEIYSNTSRGILITPAAASYNNILTNKIYNNTYGIEISVANNINIYRNLLYNNTPSIGTAAIHLTGTAVNINIYNNTFYNNNCGLYIDSSSQANLTNNIFLSHQQTGGGYSGYALYASGGSAGDVTYDKNVFWNNYRISNSSVFAPGPSNYYTPPVIDTSSTFEILSPNSICVDHAKAIPGVSIPFNFGGPDIGWKESNFEYTDSTNVVHVWPTDVWTNSITNALKIAGNNYIIECHSQAGPFYETIRIPGFTNLIIRSYDWTNSKNNTNTIIDALNYRQAIFITNSKNITILGFTIKNATNGIYIDDAVSNQILNNHIMDHRNAGIYINSDNTVYNIIASNKIYNDFGLNQDYGIQINNADYNIIYTNDIYNNEDYGIYLTGTCRSNMIKQNLIHNKTGWDQNEGIRIVDGNCNIIYKNQIFHHYDNGIRFTSTACTNQIIRNIIYSNNNSSGIYLLNDGVRYNTIKSNQIFQISSYGILIDQGENNLIQRNLIHHNNSYGIYNYNYAHYNHIINNTIYSNHDWGIRGYRSTFNIYNNIIVSNNGYGIVRSDSGTVSVGHNNIYGHSTAPWSAVAVLPGNITNVDPMIDTTSSFTITSALSPAVDSATNIYNESYQGNYLDMGWKESGFTANYVEVIPRGIWRSTINDAMLEATNNCIIQCYPKPGEYFESVQVSGKTNLIIRTFDWTNSSDNSLTAIDGIGKDRAITITNSKNITVLGFSIRNADKGIYINNAISNNISHNQIYNNLTYGILIESDTADYNIITTNRIFNTSSAQNYGIWINDADNNIIYSNQIYNQINQGIRFNSTGNVPYNNKIIKNLIYNLGTTPQDYGILLRASRSNTIISNYIFRNEYDGIYLDNSGTAGSSSNKIIGNCIYDNSRYGIQLYNNYQEYNNIIGNTIYNSDWNWRQNEGIHINGADHNIIYLNTISRHENYGIYMPKNSISNYIAKNIICSNRDSHGIFLDVDNGNTYKNCTQILTNQIYANAGQGIYLFTEKEALIARNLIYKNKSHGIRLYNYAYNNKIINNTIYDNQSNGIYVCYTSECWAYNNIFLSNDRYGIKAENNAYNSEVGYNVFYGNNLGATNGERIIYNFGNTIDVDPMLQSYIPCAIASPDSIAVDNATNIPGISDTFTGNGPDMGWLESGFTNTLSLGPYYVDDDSGSDLNEGSFDRPFRTIQRAVNAMNSTCRYPQTYIFPGIYEEQILIASNSSSNMLITKLSNQPPVIFGSLVSNNAFIITNTGRIKIQNLIIKCFAQNGVLIKGLSTNITLYSNTICSNNITGILVDSELAYQNYFIRNNINGANQNHGIHIHNGDDNHILTNNLYLHEGNGVYLSGDASLNYIEENNLFNNGTNSICLSENATVNYIQHNDIYSNTLYGINIKSENADNNTIYSNHIFGSPQTGIYIADADNNTVSRNHLDHLDYGLYITYTATNNTVIMNNICSNNHDGIIITSGSAQYNTIISNSIWANNDNGIYLNDEDNNRIYRNLIRNNGLNGISIFNQATNNHVINNTLFKNGNHGININLNNSSAVIVNNIILSNTSFGSYGIFVNDADAFTAYNILYNNDNPWWNILQGSGNITNADPLIDTVTSFTIISVSSPAVDSGSNVIGVTEGYQQAGPDRGWKESPFMAIATVSLSKSISNVTLNNTNVSAIPGSSITYKIVYYNTGYVNIRNALIYDKISSFITYQTNLTGTATSWTMQFSTNTNPNQSYNSTDYAPTYTIKTNIKWIRWKKPYVNPDEDNRTLLFQATIK